MPKDIRNMEDQERIGVLMLDGHTEHCAKRQVWGDGECTCVADGFGTLHHTMNPPPEGWNLPVRGLSDVKIGDWHKPTPNGRPRQVSGVAPGRVYYMGGDSVRAEDLHLMTKVEPPVDPRMVALRADIERQAWNLAGCSTYAAGHGLDEGHDAAYALPALNEVRELALKYRKAQEDLATLRAERDEARGLLREADLLLAEEQLLAEASPGNMTDEERDRRFEAWFAASRGHIAEFLGLGPMFTAMAEPTKELPRALDGHINNCLLAWSGSETDPTYGPCQMCNGVCPDRAILLGRVLPPAEKTSW